MLRGRDAAKDQSYALWGLYRSRLAGVLLPVGEYTKTEIRAEARRLDLPVADKAESQDICFVEGGHYAEFLTRKFGSFAQAEPGRMVDESGQLVGTHSGVMRYTVGQRKGLGLARPAPTYVVGIDAATNTLTVGSEPALYQDRFHVSRVNFVSIDAPKGPMRVEVRVRHHGSLIPATIEPGASGGWIVVLDRPERAVTPGQSAVFYDGDVLLGGGIIEQIETSHNRRT
jgi:tRNA-specific 2-thiouridylase